MFSSLEPMFSYISATGDRSVFVNVADPNAERQTTATLPGGYHGGQRRRGLSQG